MDAARRRSSVGSKPARLTEPRALPLGPGRRSPAGGRSLEDSTRQFMSSQLGWDFGSVRVHTSAEAARAADSLSTRAFTFGRDIVFGRDQYRPDTESGRGLLRHELVHTVQQAGVTPTVQREERRPNGGQSATLPPAPIPLPGGLSLFPIWSDDQAFTAVGIPIPGALRVTNALSVGTAPRFVLDLSPNLLVGTVLDRIDLATSNVEGTPPGGEKDPNNINRISLLRPIVTFDPSTGKLKGRAVLSLPSGYPQSTSGPTKVDAEVEMTSPGTFRGSLSLGPLVSDFTLKVRYDLSTLRGSLIKGLKHPGFSLEGGLRLGPVPLSTFSAAAPSTLPLDRPLPGAPAPFPFLFRAAGLIIAPAGAITDVPVPAAGYVRSSFGRSSGTSFTSAILPTLSTDAISRGASFAEQFPVYAFAEFAHVRRVSDGLDLGFRVTLQTSTAELFGGSSKPSSDAGERLKQNIADLKTAGERDKKGPVPTFGASIFGHF